MDLAPTVGVFALGFLTGGLFIRGSQVFFERLHGH